MRIALVISSLRGGGAERVMVGLANAWARRGVQITLITLDDAATDIYHLDPAIQRVKLYACRKSATKLEACASSARLIRTLRKALLLARPDVALSFMTTTNILSILACLGTGIPVVVSERTSVADSPPHGVWKLLFRSVYRRSAGVVTPTERGGRWLEVKLQMPVYAIPNPVFPVDERRDSDVDLRDSNGCTRTLLAMGRLTKEKGFDILIKSFGELASVHPEWRLMILGEGSERERLARQIKELNLGNRVTMPGFTSNPHAVMHRADAFVLSSRFEGMPNSLLEAMAAGLPCVSFDCRTGPSEIIEHGVNGILVPPEDVSELTVSLSKLMADGALRKRLGDKARNVRVRYSLDAVLAQWDALLLSKAARSVVGSSTSRGSMSGI